MSRRFSHLTAVAAVCLGFFSVQTLVLAERVTIDIAGKVQRGPQLCWAAISEMAVNHLSDRKVSQGELAAYNFFPDLHSWQAIDGLDDRSDLEPLLESCGPKPVNCDKRGRPLLLGLTHAAPTAPGTALAWDVIVEQVANQQPIPFTWDYCAARADGLYGLHQMMVIGFSDTPIDQVLIWDPWPMETADGTSPGRRRKWISYAIFANPEIDNGLPARHGSDLFDLRRSSVPSPTLALERPRVNCPTPISQPLSGGGIPFAKALQMTRPFARRADLLRPAPPIPGRQPERGARKTNEPLPIVTLTPEELVREPHSLARLLRPNTNSVLYPVSDDREVIDAYLAIVGPNGWKSGGYANTEIARRLVEQRRRLRDDGRDFYLLAVPGWSTFFLARGSDENAELIPIATNHLFVAGKVERARTTLARLADDIRARGVTGTIN